MTFVNMNYGYPARIYGFCNCFVVNIVVFAHLLYIVLIANSSYGQASTCLTSNGVSTGFVL